MPCKTNATTYHSEEEGESKQKTIRITDVHIKTRTNDDGSDKLFKHNNPSSSERAQSRNNGNRGKGGGLGEKDVSGGGGVSDTSPLICFVKIPV